MSNMDIALKDMMVIDGALGAAVVDYNSGMALGMLGSSKGLDLQIAAAGNTEVLRAKMRTIDQLGIKEEIEDILITLTSQYHVSRPMTGRKSKGLFLYLALDRGRANLAMARHRLKGIEEDLEV
ncbi:hypothetical protein [Nocardia seriolae]|uniref:hypothetical protein n=1 Tax=Nocardia seriolae TaxID=37332 RepID=UPI00051A3067|nr:hypothetical protein [Nocardia seriolae]MTJ61945.1 hypothetical protein [Nocardia seriolae]MTJ73238.1 hypothetical protein [Nocardia seriolae]MTJ90028.1 hypothetical protein [Nocardia seriolae]MTK34001.1 hypothetical protein [Nocardia seriolae]MTK39895.1 hypothetical protein [Nocardia seriolae]